MIRLTNIILTPQNRKYAGGTWHVEGIANENVVATGLRYHACDNVTESRLDFRTVMGAVDSARDVLYGQSDQRGYIARYGFRDEHGLYHCLGHIVSEEDKSVMFPNAYEHHVDEFKPADRRSRATGETLCFFLVDPERRIPSTTDVPPRQEHWAVEQVGKVPAGWVRHSCEQREGRDYVAEASGRETVFEVEFDMCEH